MKVKIKVAEIIGILTPLQSVINDNHTTPILSCVKMDFTDGNLILTGENLEVNCSNSIPFISGSNETYCVNFSMLLNAMKSVLDKELNFYFDKKILIIKHKKGNFKIPLENVKEFPLIEVDSFDKNAIIDSKAFKNSIKVANKFVTTDGLEAMSNISISIGKKIFIRATDRNRLFEEKIKGSGDALDLLISGKSSNILYALIEDSEELNIKYNDSKVYIGFKDTQIVLIQQQGVFPLEAFKSILKGMEESTPLDLDLSAFISSVKRATVFSSKGSDSKIRLDLSKKKLVISCHIKEESTSTKEEITASFKGEKSIGFNYKYLLEIISVFSENAQLFINDRDQLFITHKKKRGLLASMAL